MIWHVLRRDSWEIHVGVPFMMLVESAVLALPLIVFDQLFTRLLSSDVGSGAMQVDPGGTAATLESLSWQARLTLSVGAGLYEELVFRMILIALIHAICVDIGQMKPVRGAAIALGVSAIAFAAYHRDVWGGPGLVDAGMLTFYLGCGLYFGSVYVVRGFGVVVGAHAMYDIVAVLVLG
jgi:membrane protease YdiL (CAAX protease family)